VATIISKSIHSATIDPAALASGLIAQGVQELPIKYKHPRVKKQIRTSLSSLPVLELLIISMINARKIVAAFHFLLNPGRYGNPSLKWLFHTSSRCDARFEARFGEAFKQIPSDAEFLYVVINRETFVWPKSTPIGCLKQILSELIQEDHPHHYDVPPTKITANDIVLDIGACEGAFAASAMAKGAKVMLVEPSRTMQRVIRQLFMLRELGEPRLFEYLLGDVHAQIQFLEDGGNPGGSRAVPGRTVDTYPVEMLTLDEFALRHLQKGVTYIKCDAEGWDYKILKAGSALLKKYRPKISVTTYHNRTDYRDISELLHGLNYSCSGKGLLYSGDALRTLMLHAVPR
jgi:FkbM family methyltransferase